MRLSKRSIATVFVFILIFCACSKAGVNSDILKAAEEGDLKAIKRCLKNGVDVNAKDNEGASVLIIAAKKGHVDIVSHLIYNGAD